MNTKTPYFSVIIPTLNEEKYLPNLLTDIANQSFKEFEVIVVDGKSNDKTITIAKQFESKLPSLLILNSTKRHVCVQRNVGAAHANGHTLIFMDADTRISSSFLQGMKYRWETNNCDVLTTWLIPDINTPTNNAIAFTINAFFDLQYKNNPKYLLEALIVISKHCFDAIGGFDETVHYAEGKTLIQNIIKGGFKACMVHDPVYTFSFRRVRKYGVLGITSRIARIELSDTLGLDSQHNDFSHLYPMEGGSFFDKPNRRKFLTTIRRLSQSRSERNKFLHKIEKMLVKLVN